MDKKIWILIGILLLAFIAISLFALTGTAQPFNDFVYNHIALSISPATTSAMKIVSNAGEWFVYVPLALFWLIVPKTRRSIGIPIALVLAASAIGNILIKELFQIARPDGYRLVSITGYGFPSGHAMNGTAFAGICAYLFCKYARKKQWKTLVTATSVLFVLLVGFSRVYLGVHAATDVIAGYLCGSMIVLAAILIIQTKTSIRQTSDGEEKE